MITFRSNVHIIYSLFSLPVTLGLGLRVYGLSLGTPGLVKITGHPTLYSLDKTLNQAISLLAGTVSSGCWHHATRDKTKHYWYRTSQHYQYQPLFTEWHCSKQCTSTKKTRQEKQTETENEEKQCNTLWIKPNRTHMLTLSTLVILNTISETPPTGMRSLPVVNNSTCFCRSVDISVTTAQKFLVHNHRHQHTVLA